MARERITINGIPELQRALAEAGAEVRAAAIEAVSEETKAIRDDARRTAPEDTGELRGKIRSSAEGTDGTIKSTARHAQFVEHGTKGTPAQPYMLPAAERARRRLPERAATLIKVALGRSGQ